MSDVTDTHTTAGYPSPPYGQSHPGYSPTHESPNGYNPAQGAHYQDRGYTPVPDGFGRIQSQEYSYHYNQPPTMPVAFLALSAAAILSVAGLAWLVGSATNDSALSSDVAAFERLDLIAPASDGGQAELDPAGPVDANGDGSNAATAAPTTAAPAAAAAPETDASTPAPTTVAPATTAAPATVAPTTAAPTTAAPATAAPTTAAPTTAAPTTAAPTTAPPTTAPPTTAPPTTAPPTTAAPTTQAPAPPAGDDSAVQQEVLALTNQERAANGCPALALNGQLNVAADNHSEDMAARNYFDHSSPEGEGPGARIADAGYQGRGWGENIAVGYGSAASVVEGWMNSPGHRANILNCGYNELGVGYAQGASNGYTQGIYWTQVFGTR